MKKIIYLLSITLLILQSCSSPSSTESSNPTSSQSILIKRIVSTQGGIENFVYDGNKLLKILFDDGTSSVFTYTGDLITRIEIRDATNTFMGEFYTISYLNNKVSQRKSYHNNILVNNQDYTYNSDGTITIIVMTYSDLNGNYQGTGIYKNYLNSVGNLIKQEYSSGNSGTSTKLFTYDTKNSPYKNILGYNAIIDDSINNLTNTNSIGGLNQTYNYQYNDLDFPISQVEITQYVTYNTQYYY
ncbi:hypothetical protein [Flavobacterium sp.]|jgi:hypothetical protein|uniref:hypothetical protein n=1 Tax=Flavobacterium sp. TaxID=239 RepID=UPI0037C11387